MEAIKKNSTGKLVTYLQKKLLQLNYSVDVNGSFDGKTETAVKSFQTSAGILTDGIVGKQTWVEIYLKTESPRNTISKNERNNNIMLLHPKVRKAVVAVYTTLQAEDIPFKIFEAFRFPQRQEELYSQGRTKPGSIVTYAKAWSSYHQYGLAVDFVLYINNVWSWESGGTKKSWWARLPIVGESEGLMRLDFETPHLQISGTSSNALKEGVYPPEGDESWAENLTSAIIGWHSVPEAPPSPAHSAVRPPIL